MREKSLRIFCTNVRGLVCNWNNARSFNWKEYDIVAFNEVWGIKEFENLSVDGFEIKAKKTRQQSRGGGTIIFGKKELETKELNTPFLEGIIETTGLLIGNINFINIYRPPGNNADKDVFLDVLSTFLENKQGQKIIIGGDLNLNNLTKNKWLDFISNNFQLTPRIKSITRIDSGT